MALDLTQKTEKPKPFTGARIFFGVKPPKNWKANSAMRQDPVYKQMALDWMNAKDEQTKDKISKQMVEYKEKRLTEMGFRIED